MKFFGKADAIFASLIVGTVLLKVLVLRTDPSPNDGLLVSHLKETLDANGFSTRVEANPPLGRIVLADKQACRLWARDYPPYGTYASYLKDQAAAVGPLVFAYNGALHSEPPKLQPLMRFYLGRELARAGLKSFWTPVIAVAASPDCELETIDWGRVAQMPW